jgi:hypothetical protein
VSQVGGFEAKDVQGFDGYLDILSSRPGMRPENQVRRRLFAGGNGIRTLGPSVARGLHAVENVDVRLGRRTRLRKGRVRGQPQRRKKSRHIGVRGPIRSNSARRKSTRSRKSGLSCSVIHSAWPFAARWGPS